MGQFGDVVFRFGALRFVPLSVRSWTKATLEGVENATFRRGVF